MVFTMVITMRSGLQRCWHMSSAVPGPSAVAGLLLLDGTVSGASTTAGSEPPYKLSGEILNARVMLEVGTFLLITARVGKWSGQVPTFVFVLHNPIFPSLPRVLPVPLASCLEKIAHWNKVMAATTIVTSQKK